jgi:hypothetical protein
MLVGKIISFDKTTNTAKVNIAIKRKLANGTVVKYPVLADCPVIHMQGGGAFLEFPITAGDTCMVLFSDRSLDSWFISGTIDVPDSSRTHSISDGIVLVGVQPKTSALVLDGTSVNLNAKTHKLKLQNNDCSISIDSGVKVDAKAKKVRIKNNAKNLKAILEAFVDLTQLIITSGASNGGGAVVWTAPVITDFTAIKTQIAQLLED